MSERVKISPELAELILSYMRHPMSCGPTGQCLAITVELQNALQSAHTLEADVAQ